MNYFFDGSKEQIVVKMGKAHAIAHIQRKERDLKEV